MQGFPKPIMYHAGWKNMERDNTEFGSLKCLRGRKGLDEYLVQTRRDSLRRSVHEPVHDILFDDLAQLFLSKVQDIILLQIQAKRMWLLYLTPQVHPKEIACRFRVSSRAEKGRNMPEEIRGTNLRHRW